jgi:hypothetical protein
VIGGISPLTPNQWLDLFWELLNEITLITPALQDALTRCLFYSKPKLVLGLRNCIVMAKTVFVELHRLMFTLHVDSRRVALAAIDDIIDTILGVDEDDYPYLDAILVVCSIAMHFY